MRPYRPVGLVRICLAKAPPPLSANGRSTHHQPTDHAFGSPSTIATSGNMRAIRQSSENLSIGQHRALLQPVDPGLNPQSGVGEALLFLPTWACRVSTANIDL